MVERSREWGKERWPERGGVREVWGRCRDGGGQKEAERGREG